jgi:hypothetical protein
MNQPNAQSENPIVRTLRALASLSDILLSLQKEHRVSAASVDAADGIEAAMVSLATATEVFLQFQTDHSTMVSIIAAYRHRVDVQLREAQSRGAVCAADAIELVDLLGDAITGKKEHAAQVEGANARALAIPHVGLTYVSSGVFWGPAAPVSHQEQLATDK